MKRLLSVLLMASLLLGAGCGEDDNGGDEGQEACPAGQTRNEVTGVCEGGGDAGIQDTGEQDAAGDAGTEDTGESDATQQDAAEQDAAQQDAAQGETGTVIGLISRQASTQPEEDGVGNLYVAVFDRDPITNRDSAQLVGFQLIEDADVSSATAEIAYRIEGITPRSEPYYVTAFLDDDDTADMSNPENAGPDKGDLVALKSPFPPASKQVTIDSAGEFELDLLLNFNMI